MNKRSTIMNELSKCRLVLTVCTQVMPWPVAVLFLGIVLRSMIVDFHSDPSADNERHDAGKSQQKQPNGL